jgi:rhodanese-related sulfurtransferase
LLGYLIVFLFCQGKASSTSSEGNVLVLKLGETFESTLTIINRATNALVITNVAKSCECLRVLAYPRQIGPATKGEILVQVAAVKEGHFRYELVAETSDSVAPRKTYFLDVSVVPEKPTHASALNPRALESQLPVRVVQAREQSLYLSVEDVVSKRESLSFVDVRDCSAFAAAHIPGAINLPLHKVKSAGFLRARQLVLLDDGWGNPALEDECRNLIRIGFAVRILRGGMNAWQSAGGALEPTRGAIPDFAELQPRDYLVARRFDDWLVVDAQRDVVGAGSQIPEAVSIPFVSGREGEFAQSLAEMVARRGSFVRVLIVTGDGRENALMRRSLPALDNCSVFFLAEGHQALREELAMRTAMTQSRTEHTGVSSAMNGQLVRKPCGSCP